MGAVPPGVGNMNIKSLIHNLFIPDLFLTRTFSKENLRAIEEKIENCELSSSVQIVFAYQVHLRLIDVFRNVRARDLAIKEFSKLAVWDTENNTGILFYLLLAERKFEIVVDRGISNHIPSSKWREISDQIEKFLTSIPVNEAVLQGIELISREVELVMPRLEGANNEIGNRPIKI